MRKGFSDCSLVKNCVRKRRSVIEITKKWKSNQNMLKIVATDDQQNASDDKGHRHDHSNPKHTHINMHASTETLVEKQ